MIWVKICGITNAEDTTVAVEAGADALGFNFWRPGRRYIAPEAAARIIASLPVGIWKVGVFVDEEPQTMLEIARQAGLTAIQFHGSESAESVDAIAGYGKLKAVRVDDRFSPQALAGYRVDAFLLDAAGSTPGGTGQPFDWQRAAAAKPFGRIILAGGLTPQNVGEAIRRVRPWGVDVASGVESEPGRKDAVLVRAFMAAARAAEV
jgi:phosphoribosylanthranilate isomerase